MPFLKKKSGLLLMLLAAIMLSGISSILTYKGMYEAELDDIKSTKDMTTTANLRQYSGLTQQKSIQLCKEYISKAGKFSMNRARIDQRSTRVD